MINAAEILSGALHRNPNPKHDERKKKLVSVKSERRMSNESQSLFKQ